MMHRVFIQYPLLTPLIAGMVLGAAATAGVVFLQKGSPVLDAPENPFPGMTATDLSAEQEHWRERINSLGADAAYEAFKADNESTPYGMQHAKAHLFGDVLYQVEGVAGVSTCDTAFAFGCYHSFFGRAIATEGLGVIHELDRACIDAYGLKGLGCQHGLGHGVLSYVGEENLDAALDECDTLTWDGPIGGCTSGVFMEYNFRTMEDPSGVSVREPEDGALHAPCRSIDEAFRLACYFEQPQWWQALFRDGEGFVRVGELCGEVVDAAERRVCYMGTGNAISSVSNASIDRVIEECTHMPSSEGRTQCLTGGAWIISADPDRTEPWERICEDLTGSARETCLRAPEFI